MWQNVRKSVGLAHLLLHAPCNIHYEILFFHPKLQFGNLIKKNLDLQKKSTFSPLLTSLHEKYILCPYSFWLKLTLLLLNVRRQWKSEVAAKEWTSKDSGVTKLSRSLWHHEDRLAELSVYAHILKERVRFEPIHTKIELFFLCICFLMVFLKFQIACGSRASQASPLLIWRFRGSLPSPSCIQVASHWGKKLLPFHLKKTRWAAA